MPQTGQSHVTVFARKPSWQPFHFNEPAPFFNNIAKKGGRKSNFMWQLVPGIPTKIPIRETREACYQMNKHIREVGFFFLSPVSSATSPLTLLIAEAAFPD